MFPATTLNKYQTFRGHDIKDIQPLIKENCINWIQVHGLQNTETIHEICNYFNIDFLTIQTTVIADLVPSIPDEPNLKPESPNYSPIQYQYDNSGNRVKTIIKNK